MEDKSPSIAEKLVFVEIGGKNAAIHAYDKIIWQVRLGFLTLVFGGWTLIIESSIEIGKQFQEVKEYFIFMSVLSIITAIGAFAIDKKYVKNKFRVVLSLTKLQEKMLEIRNDKMVDNLLTDIQDYIGVVGDSGDAQFKGKGYNSEMTVVFWIYATTIAACVFVIWYSY